MKRIFRPLIAMLLSVCLAFSLSGCALLDAALSGEGVTVTFVIEDKKSEVSVPLGDTVSPPKTPQIEDRIFSGWYTDSACKNEYDFSTPVLGNLTLYAGFVLDGAAITNEITVRVMPALVTVENVYPAGPGKEAVAQGSGFLYKIAGGRAYVLTNCHVAYSSADQQTITVEDFRGEKHEATIYRKNASASPAIAAEYDLAILTFLYDGDELSVIPFADQSARARDEVISLGSPGNQSHAITYGEMLGLRLANLAESDPKESNVTFEIIYHTAAVTNGSSGGPLINGDLALVGVNYAGIPGENNDSFGHGCAVPIEKVREFLALYE